LRRFLLPLLAVPALLIGILAMHSFSTENHIEAAAHSSSSIGSQASEFELISESDPACAGHCDSELALGFACLLALVMTGILFLCRRPSRITSLTMSARPTRNIRTLVARENSAPSLLLLSVIRV
jgi:hypothetical protein